MTTLPPYPRPATTPLSTAIPLAVSLAAVVFLVLAYLHHCWLRRTHPRPCLVYESSSDESLPPVRIHDHRRRTTAERSRGGRSQAARDHGARRRGQQEVTAEEPRWWRWRRCRHPHAYCRTCEARRERDLEMGEEKVRRPRPTYMPAYVRSRTVHGGSPWRWTSNENGHQYEFGAGDGEEDGPGGNWRGQEVAGAKDEQWRGAQRRREEQTGYGANRGRARMARGGDGRMSQKGKDDRDERRHGNQNWKALQWQYYGRNGTGADEGM